MNIFLKLQELTKLTDSEKALTEYICQYPEEVIYMDINVLCEKTFVSKPTIYRLCKKLGMKGYSDLKVTLASSLHEREVENTDYNYPFTKKQTTFQIIEEMSDLYHQTIDATKGLLDLENVRLVVQELLNAETIKVFPSSGNVFMAQSFQQNMQEIGVLVDVKMGKYDQHWSACATKEGDVVIVISYLGKTASLDAIVKVLKRQKAKIILISATYEEKLSKFVDYNLYVCSYEHYQNKIGSFSSRVSLQYILDTVYACYFNRNYEENETYKITNYID